MSISSEITRIKTAVTSIAQAIRGKGVTVPTTAKIGDLSALISSIKTPNLQSKTVSPLTSSQTVKPDSGYNGLSQVTVNAMPTATQATPSISVSSAGLITASATQTAGYVSAGTKSKTYQLTARSSGSLTASGLTVTAPAGYYHANATKTLTDANLTADKIRKGYSIFGVAGSYEGSGGFAINLPTRTVTVVDNDGAGDIVMTTLTNEGGKLIWKNTSIPMYGRATITYAWRTPVFLDSGSVGWFDVYDVEGDYMRNCPYYLDQNTWIYAIYPQIDGGESHTIECYL